MYDENYLSIQGRLTADPTLTTSKAGKDVCRFSIANNMSDEKVFYFDCVAFEGTAKLVAKNIKKGTPVIIKGRLSSSSYQDEASGKKLKSVNIIVSTIWEVARFKKADQVDDNPFQDEIPM
jgi:single-strand DNA-binding protein